MTLYFIIFGNLIGSQIGAMHGFSYMQFIVPGLIMMAVITNAYTNVASSFFSAQITVARTERQTIGGAHRRYADNVDIIAHVPHQLTNKRQLLKVLFAKAGHVRLYQIEQFADNRGHAAKMARAAFAFQDIGEARHIDKGLTVQTVRINHRGRRSEYHVHAAPGQLFTVFLQRARISRQIFRAVELHRIDENAHHDFIRAGAPGVNQRHMPFMQIAHCRNEGDTFMFLTPLFNRLTQRRRRFDNQHASLLYE